MDFFSPEQIADRIDEVLEHTDRMSEIRKRARATVVSRYDLKTIALPAQLKLVEKLLARKSTRNIPPTGGSVSGSGQSTPVPAGDKSAGPIVLTSSVRLTEKEAEVLRWLRQGKRANSGRTSAKP